MKIRVNLTITVDPAAWDAAYGTGSSPAQVRDDVRTYVLNQVQQSAAAEETGLEAKLLA